MMSQRVKPRVSRGLRDLLPEEMMARQSMIDTIRRVYESYGFSPISTPAIEYLDVLTGSEAGEEAQGSIFTVSNPEEEALGLRFDLTVPLARVVAEHRELPRPFRRYQVAPVWRADKPDKGRYREFTQFDLDSVGTVSEIADTEIIAGMCDTLDALDVGGYRVRYSSRQILNTLLAFAGIAAERAVDVFRVLDKLDKVGFEKVAKELTTGYEDKSGDVIRGLGLAQGQVDRIGRFLDVRAELRSDVVAQLRELFAGVEGADEAIGGVEKISRHLYALGYGDDKVALDLSIARGLAYYTGPVFEANLSEAPQFGSVFGGGRYDGLVMRFLGERVPATGASIGVDRLLAALTHLGKVGGRTTAAEVLVLNMDSDLEDEVLAMTFELRRAGIPTELYVGTAKNVGKQLKYADRSGVPLVLMYGSNEKEQGVVTVKDLDAGRRKSTQMESREDWIEERPGQQEVRRSELVAEIRRILAKVRG
ncbi:MAG: histidine--tRNA ligase [Acidobacteria bacterium]|nr:histidine--tRNA ligase [Acidobacteriota bacterium]